MVRYKYFFYKLFIVIRINKFTIKKLILIFICVIYINNYIKTTKKKNFFNILIYLNCALTVLKNIGSVIYSLYEGRVFAIVAFLFCYEYNSIRETRDRRRVIDHLLRERLGNSLLAKKRMFLHLFLGSSDKIAAVSRLVAQCSRSLHRLRILLS